MVQMRRSQAKKRSSCLFSTDLGKRPDRLQVLSLFSIQSARRRGFSRTAIVWSTLIASMTCVGGVMLMLDGSSPARTDSTVLTYPVGPQIDQLETIWNTRRPVDRDRWTHIVIHASGASHGDGASIARDHEARGFRGLGYHFVLGNGRGAPDGSMYIGYRWLDQLPGVHAGGPSADYLNRHSIGICLVGDGDRRQPTEAQMTRLIELVRSLRTEFDIPASGVLLHSQVANTTSPGRFFPAAEFRERLESF
jgi:hypothetical protein